MKMSWQSTHRPGDVWYCVHEEGDAYRAVLNITNLRFIRLGDTPEEALEKCLNEIRTKYPGDAMWVEELP